MNSTDQQLWRSLRDGDESAFTAIFDRYHRTLYNYGNKLVSDSALTEDAVQEVFIDVWRMRATLSEDINSIKFYLYRSLRRRIHRMQDKYQTAESIDDMADDEKTPMAIAEETVQIEQESRDLVSRRIQELLTHLPKRQVEALTLYYFDDFGISEIAQIMDVNEKSVRNFIHRALTSLRQNRNWLIGSLLIFWLLLNL
ncbi:sigma-70 family RNA polymerase sigma factor [Spirosoma endbachense]|uniref:Sigma-70 family RNA polymerase sigma factor n=1 Tax=Spirosoma endbachense TaxID=2666025 RepID=A0A6P1W873_9BACT|nr:sigma-70 family RNA polymerase sigma factor [Spirosoma endbachense]